jgi:superfamily II DNA or RNA helicase
MKIEDLKYFESIGFKGNYLKDAIQVRSIDTWLRDFKGIGCILAYTVFGKTEIARKTILRFRKRSQSKITIIVPTSKLYKDWKELMVKEGIDNYEIYIINTYTINLAGSINETELLIVDEVHHCLGEDSTYFKGLLDKTKYNYFLGLSATLNKEHINFLKDKNINVAYEISLTNGVRLDLLPKSITYNLGMELSPQLKEEYFNLTSNFENAFAPFISIGKDNAFLYAMTCATNVEPYRFVPLSKELAKSNMLELTDEGKTYMKGKDLVKIIARETDYSERDIYKFASIWRNTMSERETLLQNTDIKKQTLIDIMKSNSKKTIIFCPNTKFADDIYNQFKGVSVSYHSKVSDKKRRDLLKAYEDDYFQYLLCVKALDEGFNVKNIEIGINAGFTSKELQFIQRMGRILRVDEKNPDKVAKMINLHHNPYYVETGDIYDLHIVPNDMKKLQSIQRNSINSFWVNNINQLELT